MRRLVAAVALLLAVTAPGPAGAQTSTIPPEPVLTISVNDVKAGESASYVTFTITLSFPDGAVVVSYTTKDGSATAGADYQPVSGQLTIPTESTSATVQVPLLDDKVDEPNETFTLELGSPRQVPIAKGTGVATILDDDVTPPPPTTPITLGPTPPLPTTAPLVLPTIPPTLAPGETTTAPAGPTVPPPTVEGATTTAPGTPTTVPAGGGTKPGSQEPQRSKFVRSVMAPGDVRFEANLVARSILFAALLVLLVAFPAELFNSTLLANYEEITGWFGADRLTRAREALARVPGALVLGGFAAAGALIYSQLSSDFGLNRASLALLLGMFLTFALVSLLYDQFRAWYLRRRFGVSSRLRAQVAGLLIGLILVLFARLAHFLPGYMYGVFTALVFVRGGPDERQDGEGLTVASWVLLAVGVVAWFLWPPVRDAASKDGAAFGVLVLDAALACLWVAAVGAIVFGLAPIRFFYGEQVKAWNKPAWWALYGLGMLVFVHAVMNPDRSVYSKSEDASLGSILALFVAFGAFSTLFWAYFRYRHLWRRG